MKGGGVGESLLVLVLVIILIVVGLWVVFKVLGDKLSNFSLIGGSKCDTNEDCDSGEYCAVNRCKTCKVEGDRCVTGECCSDLLCGKHGGGARRKCYRANAGNKNRCSCHDNGRKWKYPYYGLHHNDKPSRGYKCWAYEDKIGSGGIMHNTDPCY